MCFNAPTFQRSRAHLFGIACFALAGSCLAALAAKCHGGGVFAVFHGSDIQRDKFVTGDRPENARFDLAVVSLVELRRVVRVVDPSHRVNVGAKIFAGAVGAENPAFMTALHGLPAAFPDELLFRFHAPTMLKRLGMSNPAGLEPAARFPMEIVA